MRKIATSFLAVLLLVGSIQTQAIAEDSIFLETRGFATKIGFRGVFSWEASQPVLARVHYGTNPAAFTLATKPTTPDLAGMSIADGLVLGSTYYWQVEDLITGERSEVKSFKAANAYNAWDPVTSSYTINLLVQIDAQSLPPEVPHDMALANVAQGMNIFGERLYDASDGFVRLGEVLVTDTNLDYAANLPNPASQPPPVCAEGNLADVLVTTAVPFDSHTYSGYQIARPCTSFYVGRIGQLVVPWGSNGSAEDLHFGYVSTHELFHYAFNAPDLYNLAHVNTPRISGCWNLDWDGSVMHNDGGWAAKRWEFTEVDRNPTLTPCDHSQNGNYTWNTMRARYTNIPLRSTGPIEHILDTQARGNEDGGFMNIRILDREPGASTLNGFVSDDINPVQPECTPTGPQVTDAKGDATHLATADPTPGPNEPQLDLLTGKLTWNPLTSTVTFHIKVDALEDTPPPGSDGHDFRLYFNYANKSYYADARKDLAGTAFKVNNVENTTSITGLTGTFNSLTEEITINLPAARFAQAVPTAPPIAAGRVLEIVEAQTRRTAATQLAPLADAGIGQCNYTVGQEIPRPNLAPNANDDVVSTRFQTGAIISVLANDSDPDGDALTIQAVSDPTNGTTTNNQNSVTYTPDDGFFGADTFTYTVADGRGGFDIGQVTVNVNGAPVASDDEAFTTGSEPVGISVLANDVDPNGDTLQVVSVADPASGSATTDGTNVTYTPDAGFSGTDVFSYSIRDTGGDTATGTIRVHVNGVPVAGADEALARSGQAIAIDVLENDSDPDGDALTITGASDPPGGSVESNGAWLVYTPDEGFEGDDSFTYTISDGRGGSAVGAVSVHVNSTPIAESDLASGSEDASVLVDVLMNDSDPEGTALTLVGVGLASSGTTAIEGSSVRYTPSLNFNGDDTFTYEVADEAGDVSTGTVHVSILAVNDAPVAVDDSATTTRNKSVTILVLSNDRDVDGDVLTILSAGSPQNGTVVRNPDGTITYRPRQGFKGEDSFVYTTQDAGGLTSTAEVTIAVTK